MTYSQTADLYKKGGIKRLQHGFYENASVDGDSTPDWYEMRGVTPSYRIARWVWRFSGVALS